MDLNASPESNVTKAQVLSCRVNRSRDLFKNG